MNWKQTKSEIKKKHSKTGKKIKKTIHNNSAAVLNNYCFNGHQKR